MTRAPARGRGHRGRCGEGRAFLGQITVKFSAMEVGGGQGRVNLGRTERGMLLSNLFNREAELPPTGDPMDYHAMTANPRTPAQHSGC